MQICLPDPVIVSWAAEKHLRAKFLEELSNHSFIVVKEMKHMETSSMAAVANVLTECNEIL